MDALQKKRNATSDTGRTASLHTTATAIVKQAERLKIDLSTPAKVLQAFAPQRKHSFTFCCSHYGPRLAR